MLDKISEGGDAVDIHLNADLKGSKRAAIAKAAQAEQVQTRQADLSDLRIVVWPGSEHYQTD